MRFPVLFFMTALFIFSCDDTRVFEKNYDFEHRAWMIGHKPEFEFDIADTTRSYNVYCNVRNSLTYPFSRLFLTYYLQDSIGKVLDKKLVNRMLFDPKTGEPHGASGLGDLYDHRFLLLRNHKFIYAGKHKIKFEQFMRTDTLSGIIAVGVRVETASPTDE